MEGLYCTSCGGNSFTEEGRYYVCQYCGTKFLRSSSGAASFDKSERLHDLLKRADLYWRHNKLQQAKALYRQALELDANCAEALKRMR